jgi:hypothetical protein
MSDADGSPGAGAGGAGAGGGGGGAGAGGGGAGTGADVSYVLDITGTTPVSDPTLRILRAPRAIDCEAGKLCVTRIEAGELVVVKSQIIESPWRGGGLQDFCARARVAARATLGYSAITPPGTLATAAYHVDCFANLILPRARSWTIVHGSAMKGARHATPVASSPHTPLTLRVPSFCVPPQATRASRSRTARRSTRS